MIREFIQGISGYPGLLLACAASGLVLPVPEDFPLIYAGMRVADGTWGLPGVLAAAIVGVGIRDVLAWCLGRAIGTPLLHTGWVRRIVGASKIDRASDLVQRRGSVAVLMGRFFIGFRAPVFMVAGATGVPLRSFVLYDALGLVLMVPMSVAAGYAFGEPLATAVMSALESARLVVALVIAAVAIFVVYRIWSLSRYHASTNDDLRA